MVEIGFDLSKIQYHKKALFDSLDGEIFFRCNHLDSYCIIAFNIAFVRLVRVTGLGEDKSAPVHDVPGFEADHSKYLLVVKACHMVEVLITVFLL